MLCLCLLHDLPLFLAVPQVLSSSVNSLQHRNPDTIVITTVTESHVYHALFSPCQLIFTNITTAKQIESLNSLARAHKISTVMSCRRSAILQPVTEV